MNGRERSAARDAAGNESWKGRIVWWWLRLIVAVGALGFATTVVGRSFLDHVFQMRNSPAALVLLVFVIQLGWFISHAPAGGIIASLKIVLGGCALVGALLDLGSQGADGSSVRLPLDFPRIGVALLAVWVVVDGVMDRRAKLRRYHAGHRDDNSQGMTPRIPHDETPTPATIPPSPGSHR